MGAVSSSYREEADRLAAENAKLREEVDAFRSLAIDRQRVLWTVNRRANQLEGTIEQFLKTTEGRVPADSSDSLSIEAVWVHRLRLAMEGNGTLATTDPRYPTDVVALADVDSLLEGVAKQVGGMQLSVGESCVYSELVRSYKLDKGAKSLVQRAGVAEANAEGLLSVIRDIEWATSQDDGEGVEYDTCPCCGGGRPDDSDTPEEYAGHEKGCALYAAIAKAEGRTS